MLRVAVGGVGHAKLATVAAGDVWRLGVSDTRSQSADGPMGRGMGEERVAKGTILASAPLSGLPRPALGSFPSAASARPAIHSGGLAAGWATTSGASMSEKDFYREDAKQRAASSVKVVESQTSAEVVVAVRRRSGDYRAAAYHFGLAVMGLVVGYMLVAPQTFSVAAIALDGLLAFLSAVAVGLSFDSLARLLVRPSRRTANVEQAARAAFYDLGISRTSGRNGILVFVSTFERTCAIVPDIGIDVALLGPPWAAQCAAIQAAVRRPNLTAFLAALEALGPILGGPMPRADDDVNELPDEVQ
ncbi:MAG: hypothetical protein JW751_15905 [Polyangiaceae bacterium]|nr:hypothetical protein [Polyangiaceae bacterium]